MTDTDYAMTTQASPFISQYRQRIAGGQLTADPGQEKAALALDAVYRTLLSGTASRGLWERLTGSRHVQGNGLYLWGDVGRGKSMLMDLFVHIVRETAKTQKTRRVHFHAFMLDVHKRLHAFRQLHGGDDLMPRLIAELVDEVDLLCLDEMQVQDVTDAMILSRLFAGLMDGGVSVVFTSNRPPRQLYQGGLQREQFELFVDLLEASIPIVELVSPHDYRLEKLKAMARTYVYPLGEAADDFLMESWQALTHGGESQPLRLEVQGRTLRVDKHYHGTAWLTFDELCMRPLGANDYIELAQVCHTLLLQSIPALTRDYRNEAKRFVTLIDALYEQRVKLIATAETPPEGIYTAGDGNFEFHRTVSRLIEMQSESYLALAHLG